MTAPCIARRNVLPAVGPAQIFENPGRGMPEVLFLRTHEASLILLMSSQNHACLFLISLWFLHQNPKPFSSPRRPRYKRQISWKREPTDLWSHLRSKWLITESKFQWARKSPLQCWVERQGMKIAPINCTVLSSSGLTSASLHPHYPPHPSTPPHPSPTHTHTPSQVYSEVVYGLRWRGRLKLLTSKALGWFANVASHIVSDSLTPRMIDNWLQM